MLFNYRGNVLFLFIAILLAQSTPVNDLKTSNSTKSAKDSVAPIVEGEDQKTEGKGAKPKRRRKKKSKASNQVKHSDGMNQRTSCG